MAWADATWAELPWASEAESASSNNEGNLAATDEPDVFAADGFLFIEGDFAATDSPDVFAASGAVNNEGDYAATDSPDVFAADGDLLIDGELAATDSADVFFATDIVLKAAYVRALLSIGGTGGTVTLQHRSATGGTDSTLKQDLFYLKRRTIN